MMNRIFLALGIVTSIVVLPTSAMAYVTPEELLYEEDFSLRLLDKPPSRREIQDAAARQEAESAARREAEQEAYFNAQRSSSSSTAATTQSPAPDPTIEEELHGAAPAEEPTSLDPIELRDQRALERIRANAAQASYEAQLRALTDDETLHSGAPLSDTGPATWIASLAVVTALGVTLRKVWKLDQR